MKNPNGIRVVFNASGDWVVREEGSPREFGHYATRADAETVGLKLARKHNTELIVEDETGRQMRHATSPGWFGRLLGRWR